MSVHDLPVQLDLASRRVLIVGGGDVAARKVDVVAPTGAHITLVAPEVVPRLRRRDDITWHRRPYERGEVASYRLAITATGIPDVDGQVFRDGEAAAVWVNAADDIEHCSFTLPAVARSGPVTVGVATSGRSPAFASWLRRRIETLLDESTDALLDLLVEIRAEMRTVTGHTEHPGWARALDGPVPDLVAAGRRADAAAVLRRELGLIDIPRREATA